MSINVAIIDDQPLVISGLVNMLKEAGDIITVTQTYNTGEELLIGFAKALPDVLLIDIKLADTQGDILAETISQTYPSVKMLALTSYDAPAYIKIMMKAGCKGYLLKTTTLRLLVEAITSVYEGKEFIEPALQTQIVQNLYAFKKSNAVSPVLTSREMEVLQLIVEEYTAQQIADKLFISVRTVDKHRLSLLYKLGAKNTAGLVKNAIELGYYKQE